MARLFLLVLVVALAAVLFAPLALSKEKGCAKYNDNCVACEEKSKNKFLPKIGNTRHLSGDVKKCSYDFATNTCVKFSGSTKQAPWNPDQVRQRCARTFSLKQLLHPQYEDLIPAKKLHFPPAAHISLDIPQGKKLVAIGDIHGDYENMLRSLRLAGFIDEDGKWIPNSNRVLVITGDFVDRGPYSLLCLQYLLNLQKTANSEGSVNMVLIKGNHEVLVTLGYVQYFNMLEAIQEVGAGMNPPWDGYFTTQNLGTFRAAKSDIANRLMEALMDMTLPTGTLHRAFLRMPALSIAKFSDDYKVSLSHGEPSLDFDQDQQNVAIPNSDPTEFVKNFNRAVNQGIVIQSQVAQQEWHFLGDPTFFLQVKKEIVKGLGAFFTFVEDQMKQHDSVWFNPYNRLWKEFKDASRLGDAIQKLLFPKDNQAKATELLIDSKQCPFLAVRSVSDGNAPTNFNHWLTQAGVKQHISGHSPQDRNSWPFGANYMQPQTTQLGGKAIFIDTSISGWANEIRLGGFTSYNLGVTDDTPWGFAPGSPSAFLLDPTTVGNGDVMQPTVFTCGSDKLFWKKQLDNAQVIWKIFEQLFPNDDYFKDHLAQPSSDTVPEDGYQPIPIPELGQMVKKLMSQPIEELQFSNTLNRKAKDAMKGCMRQSANFRWERWHFGNCYVSEAIRQVAVAATPPSIKLLSGKWKHLVGGQPTQASRFPSKNVRLAENPVFDDKSIGLPFEGAEFLQSILKAVFPQVPDRPQHSSQEPEDANPCDTLKELLNSNDLLN